MGRAPQTMGSSVGRAGSFWGSFVADQEGHLYSRTNFKPSRAAALAEWRQLLSA